MKNSKLRLGLLVATAFVLAGLGWVAIKFDPAPVRAGTAFVSHHLCSGVFVSGLDAGRVYADTLLPLKGIAQMAPGLAYEVDTGRREVTTRFYRLFKSVAAYRDGLGCIVVLGE